MVNLMHCVCFLEGGVKWNSGVWQHGVALYIPLSDELRLFRTQYVN